MPSRPVNALLVVEPGVDPGDVQDSLPADADFNVAAVVTGAEEALGWLRGHPADLLLVACAGYSDRALLLLDAVAQQNPDLHVMVLGHGSPNGFLRRAFEAGADDIVMLPATPDQVRFEVHKMLARKQGGDVAGGSSEQSRLVCILGPKGGTGKTLTAANLGVWLASAGNRAVAVDLDLQFGDLGLSLGLAPDRTIFDLAKSAGSIDAEKIDAYLASHESGLRLLLAPSRPDQASAVTVEFLREIYGVLRSSYDVVVVDTPPGFTPEVIATIDNSTEVLLIGMLDSLSLKNTKLGLETLSLMGYDQSRIRIVLNRADSRVGISPEDVEAVLGRPPDVLVPSDREIPRALNEGVPIATARRGSEAAKAFKRLADLYDRSGEKEMLNGNGQTGRRRLIGRSA